MIEKAVHEVINDTANPDAVALLALLSADRIVTGTHHDRDLPYACINLEGNGSEYRANTGKLRTYAIRFSLWHENHTAGCAIRDAIEQLFENKSFETSAAKLKCSRHENTLAIEENDGVWQFTIDMTIQATKKDT